MRPDVRLVSEWLAYELGQLSTPIVVADELRAGIFEEREVVSSSSGVRYPMVRTAGGWQHANGSCRGWVFRDTCRHVKDLNKETGMTETALVPAEQWSALAIVDEIEDEEIVAAIGKSVTKAWIYEFPMGGETVRGLSATGVEEAGRELAKHGEAIREIDVKIEYEDAMEARFIAQAGRYAISGDGREQLLDVAIRAKRQSKTEKRRDGKTYPDDNWYEKGITKAVRNAKLALLPETVRIQVLAAAVNAGRVRRMDAPKPGPRAQIEPPANVDRETGEIKGSTDKTSEALNRAIIGEARDLRAQKDGAQKIAMVYAWAEEAFPYAMREGAWSHMELRDADAKALLRALQNGKPPATEEEAAQPPLGS